MIVAEADAAQVAQIAALYRLDKRVDRNEIDAYVLFQTMDWRVRRCWRQARQDLQR